MRHPKRCALAASVLLLLSQTAFSQETPSGPVAREIVIRTATDFSAVGSNGNSYRVLQNLGLRSLTISPAVVPDPPSSILEAFDLNPNTNKPVDSISFSGIASQLAIGQDNRLFLVVNVTPPVTILGARNARFVPVPMQKSRLYIIPTPFPPRVLGVTLESMAGEAGSEAFAQDAGVESEKLDRIVQADLDGVVHSLKVKQVGDQEYLYLTVSVLSYRFPTLTGTSDGAVPAIAPIRAVTKLIIFNNNGRKIKEADSE